MSDSRSSKEDRMTINGVEYVAAPNNIGGHKDRCAALDSDIRCAFWTPPDGGFKRATCPNDCAQIVWLTQLDYITHRLTK